MIQMRKRFLPIFLSLLALAWAAGLAQAGALRTTGKGIAKGTTAVASAAATGGEAVAGGAATAGKTTGSVVKRGAVGVARGTAAAAKGVWKAVW